MSEIMAVRSEGDNAQIIADCVTLGYINGRVLDATYGRGRWWTKYVPDNLYTNDLNTLADYDYSFTHFPTNWLGIFDTVAYDPPYKLNGTPGGDVDDRYGVGTPERWQDRMDLISRGLDECTRVLAPGGHLLCKVQDQVCSGKVRWQTTMCINRGTWLGLDLVDRFDLVGCRPQPEGRRQVHARRNHSTMLVFKKVKK